MMSHISVGATLLVASLLITDRPICAQSSAKPELKVMSFNIRFGSARDGDNHWNKRKELVAKTIESYNPDLLGLQETLPFQAEFLKQQLEGYKYVGWSRDKDPNGEQCGIMFRKERFKPVKSGQFWLSETPEKKASKSWDSSLPRVATWVVLKDRQNQGNEFLFLNTHFDHRGRKARMESAKLIKKWLQKNHPKSKFVITGDFNCAASSKPYNELVSGAEPEIKDSFAMMKKGTADIGTFNGFRGAKSGARIDWILGDGSIHIIKASIDHSNDGGRYPSDHFPVNATIRWDAPR